MKIGYHTKDSSLSENKRFTNVLSGLTSAGVDIYPIFSRENIQEGTDMVLSFGGDGTFLRTAQIVSDKGLPILGVNFGRLGFLSENAPETVLEPLLSGKYSIEERGLLQAEVPGYSSPLYALNELCIHRLEAEMLGIDVKLSGVELPTYWADGILVATASGSTAYNLSAGGPICPPDTKVFILTPVSPHNLGLRPLVLSNDKTIELCANARSGKAALSLDNRTYEIESGTTIQVKAAPFCLKRVNLAMHSFIDALRSRLFWGQDVRNMPK